MIIEKSWLEEKLDSLLKEAEELSNLHEGVYYEVGAWAPLKLIVLLLYLDVYTKIIPKHFESMVYVDLLAGSGINQIRGAGRRIIGSPLIAATASHRPFTKLLLVEGMLERSKALEERLKTVIDEDRFEVYHENCNAAVDKIVEEHLEKRRSHHLAFIDCQGLDVDWATMEKILEYPGDLIFTFQTALIIRTRDYPDRLNKFYGDDSWKTAKSGDDFLRCYEDKLREYRDIVINIRIKEKRRGGFYYHLIFATRKTKGGNPWLQAVDLIKNRIENHTGDAVKYGFDVLSGDATKLDWFIPEEDKQDAHQRSLFDF